MSKIRNYLGRNFQTLRVGDKLTSEDRSLLMSRIRSKKTNFELEFFHILKKHKIKFRSHPKNIYGRPDVILKDYHTCIFLDSDFWHGWQYPRWKHKLKNDFWRNKIERNRKRDKKVTRTLRMKGWIVLRFWEHNILIKKEIIIKKMISSRKII
jgi:DNA mismatch endonuclease, patch repair protein